MNKQTPTPPNSTWVVTPTRRWLISSLIVLHFGAIATSYAANWRRSALQDQVLTLAQPYLIGGNWYQEMLPVEWYIDATRSRHTWLSIQTKSSPDKWVKLFDSRSKGLDAGKRSQLIKLMVELSENQDSDGLSRIMTSIATHIEKFSPSELRDTKPVVLRMRLERELNETLEESANDAVLFEGAVARFEDGEIGFVPTIDRRRTVQSTNAERGAP